MKDLLQKPFLYLLIIVAVLTYYAYTKDSRGDIEEQLTRVEILDLNHKLTQAYVDRDMVFLEAALADNHVHNNVFGLVMNKDTFLEDIRSGVLVFKSYETPEIDVQVFGDVCVATGQIEAEVYRDGHEVAGPFTFTRVFKKQPDGTWQVSLFHNTMVRKPGTV